MKWYRYQTASHENESFPCNSQGEKSKSKIINLKAREKEVRGFNKIDTKSRYVLRKLVSFRRSVW